MERGKHSVTPERAVQILKEHNIKITIEQAEKVLDFMNKFAKLAIDQYVK